jgi:hypothetical protein
MICGALRHIPFGWRVIDCSFGILGALPLWYCLHLTRRLDRRAISAEAAGVCRGAGG